MLVIVKRTMFCCDWCTVWEHYWCWKWDEQWWGETYWSAGML